MLDSKAGPAIGWDMSLINTGDEVGLRRPWIFEALIQLSRRSPRSEAPGLIGGAPLLDCASVNQFVCRHSGGNSRPPARSTRYH